MNAESGQSEPGDDGSTALEAGLLDADVRWQLATEGSGLGVWDWDVVRGEVFYSRQWKALLGHDESGVGTGIEERERRVHPDDRIARDAAFAAMLRGQTLAYRHEHRLRCADGSWRWVAERGRVIRRDAGGAPQRVIGTLADIQRSKDAELRLREREQRFRAIFNSTFQFIGLLDPDGTLLEANQTAVAFSGRDVSELVGRPFWDTWWWQLSEATRQRLRRAVARAAAGEFVRYEEEVQGANGQRLTIDFSLKPVFDAGGAVVLLIPEGRDVSESRRARAAMAESEANLRLMIEHAPIGKALVGLDGRFLAVNEALCRIVGYDAATLMRKTFADITHPEDLEADLHYVRELNQGLRERYTLEKRYVRADGSLVDIQLDGSVVRDAAGAPLRYIAQIQDVSERKCHERALREASHLSEVTLAAVDEGIIRTDVHGRITLCNPAAARMLRRSAAALQGEPFAQVVRLIGGDEREPMGCPVESLLRAPALPIAPLHCTLRTADGAIVPVTARLAPLHALDGALAGALFVFRDISEALASDARLSFQARHDALTGVGNRHALQDVLAARLAEPAGEAASWLLVLDIDGFKLVNDGSGHAAGDRLLRELAELLRAQLRAEDFIARTGGDEFAVVLPRIGDFAARRVADKLVQAVADYRFVVDARVYAPGLSVGLTRLEHGLSPSDALSQAGLACSAAKALGRGRVHAWAPDDAAILAAKRMLDWAQRLRDALEEDYLSLYLQPVVDARGTLRSYECLLRLQEPGVEVVFPGDFMKVAARLGLMGELDRWVCRKAFALLSRTDAPCLPEGIGLGVNLTPGTLADAEFRHWLLLELGSRPQLAGRLRFELTETQQMQFGSGQLELLNRLRELGFALYLDDFGSGYNSFDLLKRVRVDGLKLDASVTRDYLHDPVDQALVHAAVSITRRLNLRLVAEGVESRSIFEFLAELGVDQFQGHLFGAAVPVSVVLAGTAASAPPANGPLSPA